MKLFDTPAAVHEFDSQPVQQFRMRRRIPHLAEIVESRNDAASEVMMPDAVDNHAGRQRVFPRGKPFRQSSPASGGLSIRRRNLRGRISVGRHGYEARLHLRSMAVRIATDKEKGRRNLISPGPRVQEASFTFLHSAFHAADDLVAISEGSESIIAIRDNVRNRERLRFLFLEGSDL